MNQPTSLPSRRARFMDAVRARFSARGPAAKGFVWRPEPRFVGSIVKGRHLASGRFTVAGYSIDSPKAVIWDLEVDDPAFWAELHGFAWLDDLAALGDEAARVTAQNWLWTWIATVGRGTGPGWQAGLMGRRLLHWIRNEAFLLRGQPPQARAQFFQALSDQTRFLHRRASGAAPGLERLEALTGLVIAALALEGMEPFAEGAISDLVSRGLQHIDGQGAVPSRTPEELLTTLVLLLEVEAALAAHTRPSLEPLRAAIARIVPNLRHLRHADGGLPRFHGGGRGLEGHLDQALAISRIQAQPPQNLARNLTMGYARLAAGRSTLIVDASPPPPSNSGGPGHKSVLAFELTSARRPMIVNCGAAQSFGPGWQEVAQRQASHSTLFLGDPNSPPMSRVPSRVPVDQARGPRALRFQGAHDGYVEAYGLTHARTLEFSPDGRSLSGEDMLVAMEAGAVIRLERAWDKAGATGIPFRVRFHLHPEAKARLERQSGWVKVTLMSSEVWVFRHEASCTLSLEPSVYFDQIWREPRETQQIVLSGFVSAQLTRVRWWLEKAPETPVAVRDIKTEEVFEAGGDPA